MSLINKTQNKLHHLSLFLAAFGNSYLPKAEDDSQSNLEWSIKKAAIISREVKGTHLELSFESLVLRLVSLNGIEEIDILGLQHHDIDTWLRENLSQTQLEEHSFNYNLGFSLDTDSDTFTDLDKASEESILQLIRHRNLCQQTLELISNNFENTTEIRIWPHHFDTGMLIDLSHQKDMSKGLGLGYAIADTVSDVPYFYTYGWGDNTINYNELSSLKYGSWLSKEWKGGLLPANHSVDLKTLEKFYQEASTILTNKLF